MWVAVSKDGRLIDLIEVAQDAFDSHLYSMGQGPEHRGSGVGGRLLNAALPWAKESHPGLPFPLDANPKQRAAARSYGIRGFLPTGISEPPCHTDGEMTIGMVLRM